MKPHLTERELIEYEFKLVSDIGAERAAEHLAECQQCREHLEQLRRKFAALDLLREETRVSDDLISQVVKQTSQPVQLRVVWFRRPAWLAAAAVLVVALLLLSVPNLTEDVTRVREVAKKPSEPAEKFGSDFEEEKQIVPTEDLAQEVVTKPTLAMAGKEKEADRYAAFGKAEAGEIADKPPFAPASAIELVVLPRRDKVQLTIYNSTFQTRVTSEGAYGGFSGPRGPRRGGGYAGYGSGYGQGYAGYGGSDEYAQANPRRGDLTTLIQETIEPESWFDLSDTGEGTIQIYDNRKLIVSQTRQIHRQIENLLQAITKLPAEQVESLSWTAIDQFGADPVVYKQMDQIVDLSKLTRATSLSDAIDVVRNSVDPPLKIVVLWRDLLDSAEIEPDTQINMDGLAGVRLVTGLENLLKAVAGAFTELDYVVTDGVITIATVESLPQKIETRVYDISDLGGLAPEGQGGYTGSDKYGKSKQRSDDLTTIIQEAIEPESWFDLSDIGEGTIKIHDNRQLVVQQTPENHGKIEKLLQALKDLPDEQAKGVSSTRIDALPTDPIVYKQLEQVVDLSKLTPETSLSDAIDIIRNSVNPPLKIVVLWRDLLDNAEIKPGTQINMDGIAGVRLMTGLESLLKAVAGAFAELDYAIEGGVITIATIESMPRKMETRVYDVSDLSVGAGAATDSGELVVEQSKEQDLRRDFDVRRPAKTLATGLTLVRERRNLTLKKGWNWLQFMWANTLIDPTSLSLEPLAHTDKIDIQQLVFPARLRELGRWLIRSQVSGQVPFEITYFTSGLSWRAFYMGTLAQDEKTMRLQGYVRVGNNSGEDYEKAQTRLLVGKVHILDEIVELAKRQYPYNRPETRFDLGKGPIVGGGFARVAERYFYGGMGGFGGGAYRDELRRKEIVKEGLSEYFLYTIEGTETIPNEWGKRLLSFEAEDIKVESLYKYDEERWGSETIRFVKFANDEEHNLGQTPIPDGTVKIFSQADSEGHLSYIGGTSVKYIPVDEEVELNLGPARLAQVEPKLMDFKTDNFMFDRRGNIAGWDEIRTWKIEITNTRTLPIEIEITRGFGTAYWTLRLDGEQVSYEKHDATHARFKLKVEPRSRRTFEYTVTTYHGVREETSAGRN